MFNFENVNDRQKQAIQTTDGPVLITAGPGTGKTFTLVQRTIYLIQEKGVRPEQILLATFTEKAAKELVTRITNELAARNIAANLNEMYVGTFHSLCLRIIKEHLEYTRLRKNFQMLDQFDQQYTVYRNYSQFREIKNIDELLSRAFAWWEKRGEWEKAGKICGFVDKLSEELVDPAELVKDKDVQIAALGEILARYQEILTQNNFIDFSGIQTEAYWLMSNHPEVLSEIRAKIKYIMIDEYQDTNYIQEQLVFLLGKEHKNICVVGDDDQGLYRFRGATIRNILEFPQRFPAGECKIIPLVTNYRSNSDIVDFYNKWMVSTDASSFDWGRFRYAKTIEPHKKTKLHSPAAVKLSRVRNKNEWYGKVLSFIKRLKESGKVTNYNQIAFIFRSVRFGPAVELAEFLERNGVNVYSPRSNMFFERDEIKLTIGCLMLMFPQYVKALDAEESSSSLDKYYQSCIQIATTHLNKPESAAFRDWIHQRGKHHDELKEATDYAYSGLIYQMFAFEPFASILNTEMDSGVIDLRPARNIARFTQAIGKFEHLQRIQVLDPTVYNERRRIDRATKLLFDQYLRLLYESGIAEYEDDAEYAPSGCVSFLTIHQAKGMEFPIVILDSLDVKLRAANKGIIEEVEEKYFKRPAFEPLEDIAYFDFWRLYYTAFSRAQDLLVLTCSWIPNVVFQKLYSELPDVEDASFDVNEFTFHPVKDVNLKDTFSFTSHISVYETCTLQYKFYKELGFSPVRVNAMLFGTLVHQTIEDIHRAALRHEEADITPDNIQKWFDANYTSLSQAEHSYLAEPQKEVALTQVLRYAQRQAGTWDQIREAEVDVSLVKPDYIIEGKIDLIKGEGDTVELVDFKSEKKPDLSKDKDRLERYRRQLEVYAHLVEERTGHTVSKMHLYYTSDKSSTPTISFPYQKTAVDATIQGFEDTVHNILRKEFTRRAESPKTCAECDFRFFCKR